MGARASVQIKGLHPLDHIHSSEHLCGMHILRWLLLRKQAALSSWFNPINMSIPAEVPFFWDLVLAEEEQTIPDGLDTSQSITFWRLHASSLHMAAKTANQLMHRTAARRALASIHLLAHLWHMSHDSTRNPCPCCQCAACMDIHMGKRVSGSAEKIDLVSCFMAARDGRASQAHGISWNEASFA